jgi:hypothetical protein
MFYLIVFLNIKTIPSSFLNKVISFFWYYVLHSTKNVYTFVL